MGWYGLGYSGQKYKLVTGSFEQDNESSGSLEVWEFVEYQSICWLLKKDCSLLLGR
jgi:hypothetical protein